MNVPREYDNEAKHLLTHSLLLSNEDVPGTMTAADTAVLKQTRDNIYFEPRVSFAQKTSTEIGTESVPQRVTKQVLTPLMHRKSVLGDHNNWSA